MLACQGDPNDTAVFDVIMQNNPQVDAQDQASRFFNLFSLDLTAFSSNRSGLLSLRDIEPPVLFGAQMGMTVLMVACGQISLVKARKLVDAGADVNIISTVVRLFFIAVSFHPNTKVDNNEFLCILTLSCACKMFMIVIFSCQIT